MTLVRRVIRGGQDKVSEQPSCAHLEFSVPPLERGQSNRSVTSTNTEQRTA
jgi:hypothetical protein